MNIFGLNIQRREKVQGVPESTSDKMPLSQGANFTPEMVPVRNAEDAMKVSAWYCAKAQIVDAIAQCVMQYERAVPDCCMPTFALFDKRHGRKLNYLFGKRPNPYTTASQFWGRMAGQRMDNGNGVAYIERDYTGEPVAVWNCTMAGFDFLSKEFYLQYFKPGIGYMNVTARMEDGTVVFWPNIFLSADGFTGEGTLHYAIRSLSTAATNEKQAQDIAAKGGKFKILLSEDQSNTDSMFNLLSDKQRETARQQLQEQIAGNYDVMEVNGLVKAQIISQDANQMNLLQSRIHDSTVVAQFTKVPLPLLMINANNTYKAPEQLQQQFYTNTVAPMLKSAEEAVEMAIVPEEHYGIFRCHFNTSNLTRLDPKLQMDVVKTKLETGVYCVNEARAELGLAPLPEGKGGDQHLVSTNLQKLDDIKLGKNQAEQTQTKTDEEDE